jgi:hypothetical protein
MPDAYYLIAKTETEYGCSTGTIEPGHWVWLRLSSYLPVSPTPYADSFSYVLTDPPALVLLTRDPVGAIKRYEYGDDPRVVRTEAGRYEFGFEPDRWGEWWWRWECEGSAAESMFKLLESDFLPGGDIFSLTGDSG